MKTEVVTGNGAENSEVDDERHCLATGINESRDNGRYRSKVALDDVRSLDSTQVPPTS